MKKYLLLIAVLFSLVFLSNTQAQNNTVLEYCTGTWCQYCPCGDVIAENIQTVRPNVLILAYHGPNSPSYSDPWKVFPGNEIITMMGLNSYPTGVIGRRSGIQNRGSWSGWVNVVSSDYAPGVSYDVTKTYNSGTRSLQVTVNATSLRNIDSTAMINFIIYEDNLIYPQTGNAGCPGSSTWNHKWVVRSIVNGATGEQLSTGTWANNTVKTKSWTTTLDNAWTADNCKFAILVYLQGADLTSGSPVMQTFKNGVTTPVGVVEPTKIPEQYTLSQNFPNPFNPTTNIHFSIPKDANVSLKVYDMVGHEVASYINNDRLQAGQYNVEVDASSWASGVYFYTLQTNEFTSTKKMILVK
jgi:hypothetical protein